MTPQSTDRPVHRQSPIKCPKCGNLLRRSVDVAVREVTEESAQSLYCGRCGHEQWAKDKEPWNFKKFVQHYNEIAREQSGWIFDPTEEGHESATLKQRYEGIDDYRTLRQHAQSMVTYEQCTGVEGSD